MKKRNSNPCVTPRPNEAMRLFIRVSRMHHAEVERQVSCLRIHHSQHRMLMYLYQCTDNPSQREVADALGISSAAVTVTLKGLEREGYVARSMTEEDNRRNQVSITDAGRRKIEESGAIFDSVDRAVFAGFSDDEVDAFSALLTRMYENLQAMGDASVSPSAPAQTSSVSPTLESADATAEQPADAQTR